LRRADHAELEFIAGEGERRSPVDRKGCP
jgi:hypothetical protein